MQSKCNFFTSPGISNLMFLKGPIHWMAGSEMNGDIRTTKF